MKAMIFAAGLGTRLRPLTNDRPKALVEVAGTPLLAHVIQRLKQFGVQDLIVNVHHFADLVIDFLEKNDHFGLNITISDERDHLLETGGGLKKAAWFFDDGQPFLVHNVDIVSDLDLHALYQRHLKRGGLATLAVTERTSSRYLLFDRYHRLKGWTNVKTGEVRMARRTRARLKPWAFSGIHIIDPALLDLVTETGAFSIIDVYLRLAATHTIRAFPHPAEGWLDVGKKENLEPAARLLALP